MQVSDQRMKSLEANMEAERVTHLETKFNTEVLQVHARMHARTS